MSQPRSLINKKPLASNQPAAVTKEKLSSGKSSSTTTSRHVSVATTKVPVPVKVKEVEKKTANYAAAKVGKSDKTRDALVTATATGSTTRTRMQAVASRKIAMTPVHNVTVLSPPPTKRKQVVAVEGDPVAPPAEPSVRKHERARTRTINPEESVLVKLQQKEQCSAERTVDPGPPPSPVAFEIPLHEPAPTPTLAQEEDYDYEDDFESYESDFESEQTTSTSSAEDNDDDISTDSRPKTGPQHAEPLRGLDDDWKLDSGNYEMRHQRKEPVILKDIQEIGTDCETIAPSVTRKCELSGRYLDLMKKITLDIMTFSVFELKPMQYDDYMRIYGHLNASQAATQTQMDNRPEETQTEDVELATKWIQFPAQFSRNAFNQVDAKRFAEEKDGVGEKGRRDRFVTIRSRPQPQWNYNFNRMNRFLRNVANTIAAIGGRPDVRAQNSQVPGCGKCVHLAVATDFYRGQRIRNVYCPKHVPNVVVLLSEPKSSNDCLNYISVWDLADLREPQRILMTWATVTALVIDQRQPNVLLAGAFDGSLSLWDYRASSVDSNDDHGNSQKYQSPDGIAIPEWIKNEQRLGYNVTDLQPMVASLHGLGNVVALHEGGVIVIWSIIKVASEWKLLEMKKIELTTNSSPTVTLTKSNSNFEKNRNYFESNIFSDNALKELQSLDNETKKNYLIFIAFRVTDRYFITISNQRFLFLTSTRLINDSTRLVVQEALDPASMVSLDLISEEKVIIGFSNGMIKLQTICQEDPYKTSNNEGIDSEEAEEDAQESNTEGSVLDNNAGKSCAIQNIVLNERRLNTDQWYQEDESKGSRVEEEGSRRWFDHDKVLVRGACFKRGFIRSLYLARGNCDRIYYLNGMALKVYDVQRGVEIDGCLMGIRCMAVGAGDGRHYLITCLEDTVLLHQILS